MWKLILVFLKISFLSYDNNNIDNYIHHEIVVKNNLLDEEKYSQIHTVAKTSIVSKKLTYAILCGMSIDGLILALILCFVVLIPNLLIYILLINFLTDNVQEQRLNEIMTLALPMLAAFFAVEAIKYAKHSYARFPKIVFLFIFGLAFIMVFVLQWPIILVLSSFLVFFLFFMKGGEYND